MRHSFFQKLSILFWISHLLIPRLWAQEIKEEKTYPYELSNKEEVMKFRLLKKLPDHFKPDINHIYYWYINNGIHKNNGGVGGKLLHGKYISYYVDMSLKESGQFHLGQKIGKWMSWYPNGYILSITHWKNGLLQGKAVAYSEDINNWVQSNYCYGKLNGVQKIYTNGICTGKNKYKRGNLIPPKESRKKEHHKKDPTEKSNKNKQDQDHKNSIKKNSNTDSKPSQRKFSQWIKKLFTKKKKTEPGSHE
jgi:hypothetical protein